MTLPYLLQEEVIGVYKSYFWSRTNLKTSSSLVGMGLPFWVAGLKRQDLRIVFKTSSSRMRCPELLVMATLLIRPVSETSIITITSPSSLLRRAELG